jgi:hypothetical protein
LIFGDRHLKVFFKCNICMTTRDKKIPIGKIWPYNSSSVNALPPQIMKHFALRTVFAASLAILLTACGANMDTDLSTKTAATVTSVPVLAANDPAPDCAAEGCSSLRIIDANAETYRFDAQRRGADPQS